MRIKVFVLAVILALSFSPFLAAPAQAAVEMSPAEGIVATEVTVSGLTGGDSYTIKWDDTNIKVGTVPSGGQVTFTVPEAPGGDHTVKVESPTGTEVLTSSFTVLPSITIDPNSGTVGTSVTAEGTGFAAAEDGIKVIYGDTNVKTGITADDNGSWSATFAVPSATEGSHIVDASGDTTEADDVADKTFTVSPKITLNPSSGGVGTSVTVTGTGFASAETDIKVTYDGKEVRTGIVADVNGWWSTTFVVPSSTKGSHPMDASGDTTEAGDVPDGTFTVSPGINVDPTSGYVDDEIEVTGSGFANNEGGIKVTFDGVVIESGLVADDNGYWATSLTMPAGVNGAHAIDAYGKTTIAADVSDATLTILAQIVLNPKSGNVGDNVMVRGTGFSGKKDFTINYEDVPVVTGLTTGSEGSFSTSFEAPGGKSGECNVTAIDTKDVMASAIFSMEATPPDLPQIASPKDGGRVGYIGDTKVTFDWTDVSDPSGVYYALDVSDQSNFAIILVSHTDLTESEYTLTEAEALPHGKYYWRVQAIDGAGNSSDWTAPALVKVGFMTVQTFLIILASVVAFIILVSVLPRFLRKKPRKWTSD